MFLLLLLLLQGERNEKEKKEKEKHDEIYRKKDIWRGQPYTEKVLDLLWCGCKVHICDKEFESIVQRTQWCVLRNTTHAVNEQMERGSTATKGLVLSKQLETEYEFLRIPESFDYCSPNL